MNKPNQKKKKKNTISTINMSFNAPFFSFFDAINNEVDAFNRLLDNSGYRSYQPRRQQLEAGDKDKSAGKQVAKKGQDFSEIYNPRHLDDWFDNDWSLLPRTFSGSNLTPPVDILDHDKNYEIKVTVPGVKEKKDINLEYHKEKNQIVVSGEISSAVSSENKDKVKVQERISGKFKRLISLPEYPRIDADNIKADYSSGILTLSVPKLEPSKDDENAVRKIDISSQDSWSN